MSSVKVFVPACFLVLFIAIGVYALAAYPSFHGDDWQRLSRSDKFSRLWSAITTDRSPFDWFGIGMSEMAVEDMNRSFDTEADDLPQQGFWPLTHQRPKLIHTVGSICKAKWVSESNTYSGLFASGDDSVFIRFSYAKKQEAGMIVPGFGIKFLRSGVKSANFMAMYSLKGQKGSYNFFRNDFSSNVPAPNMPSASFAEKFLFDRFKTASSWPTMLGLSDVARFDADGKAANPVFPFRLQFHPTKAMRSYLGDGDDNRPLCQQIANIPPQTFYYVYAQANPDSTSLDRIGSVVVTDKCTCSRFADEVMFFQHQRKEDDLKIHPDWNNGAQRSVDTQSANLDYHFPNLSD